mgnify:CR=1 FL=1
MANQNLISLEQDDRIGAAATRLSMDRREFLRSAVVAGIGDTRALVTANGADHTRDRADLIVHT